FWPMADISRSAAYRPVIGGTASVNLSVTIAGAGALVTGRWRLATRPWLWRLEASGSAPPLLKFSQQLDDKRLTRVPRLANSPRIGDGLAEFVASADFAGDVDGVDLEYGSCRRLAR
ncbi:MAG: hypothetical protein ACKVP7_04205, partial [Hyphomicrobiaceae bacterium]